MAKTTERWRGLEHDEIGWKFGERMSTSSTEKSAMHTLKTEWKVLICAANKVMKYFFSSLAYRQQTSHSLHRTSLSIATCCRWLIPAQGSLCSAHNKLFFKLFVYTRERTTSLLFFIIHASLHFETVCFRSDENDMWCDDDENVCKLWYRRAIILSLNNNDGLDDLHSVRWR